MKFLRAFPFAFLLPSISNSAETPLLVVQPALFGSRWTEVVTTGVLTISFDLCNITSNRGAVETNDNVFQQDDNVFQQGIEPTYNEGLFYDAIGLGSTCSDAEIARNTEMLFPSVKYLLITKSKFAAMRKDEESPDTTLSLASVSSEDSIG